MATTTLRRETAEVVGLAEQDLGRIWRLVAGGASAEVALRDLLPAIVTEHGALGGAVAAEWYDEERERVAARGRFSAIPVEPDDRGSHALIGWALKEAIDDSSLRTLILGGVQRRVADHVRYTVAGSSVADPAAQGWQRAGKGGCTSGLCDMLIARGAVYTEATADFAAHDHCQCSAVPAWSGEPRPVKPFAPSLRHITDADRARLRTYLREH